ncbi:MAG: cryptochrome/photolyase family protein [Burkholderiales bacterium]
MKRLCLILGDQLALDAPLLASLKPGADALLMIEAGSEAQFVWSHQARIALFLSAMRHFAQAVRETTKLDVHYVTLETSVAPDFADQLKQQLQRLQPQQLCVQHPGEWRMLVLIQQVCAEMNIPLEIVADAHFLCTPDEFAQWAGNKKELRLEFFYRFMRQRYQVLMTASGEPEGGQWNYDTENRQGFGKAGPGAIPEPAWFRPDTITQEVLQLVRQRFAGHPGQLDSFAWPVTRAQALQALEHFITSRLPNFGPTQDAMWTNTPYAWHSLLSVALNLHLLHPREVIAAAEQAYRAGRVPLPSAEGFIRQVLGWREFIRGVYWLDMPQLGSANYYQHQRSLPRWYWTGDTHMACMRDVIGQTLRYGYAHHIQRLMVTGQFGILAELRPQEVCDWYLAIYVDAIEWVELPNTAGMALFAHGARFTSKPYIASGQYIKRMSNYCKDCRYKPEQRIGDNACPMTTLYWYFLDKHEASLTRNPRTALMARNIARLDEQERELLRQQAQRYLEQLDTL